MARGSLKEDAKRELARRLGQKPDQLLTRPELAKRLGTTEKALSVNLKSHPPFYSKGARHRALYPLEWVKQHARGERIGEPGNYIEGRQDWPPAPLTVPSGTEELLRFLAEGDESYGNQLLGQGEEDVGDSPA